MSIIRTTDTVLSRNLIAMSCVRKIIKLKSAKISLQKKSATISKKVCQPFLKMSQKFFNISTSLLVLVPTKTHGLRCPILDGTVLLAANTSRYSYCF